MNKKIDILNAWITIEQLSEGSIKISDNNYRTFDNQLNNEFYETFFNLLNLQRSAQKISDKNFKKSGIVFYFDIFDFQEITDILREKYGIPASHEEISHSNKFTFALYFDNQLNFIPEKLFFTMSGYIRYKKELPKDFLKAENSLRADLSKQFEDKEFDVVLKDLLKQYRVELGSCCYGFVKDLENGDINLHSFFIDDLEKAKLIDTKNLNRYFTGFSGEKINLDSNNKSANFDPIIIQEILQPKYYPLGRFPSESKYSLSLMQEIAVNLALNEKNDIRSVNGPPGTGKTTLLKDIFADLIVQQAEEICKLANKEVKGSIPYWEKAKLGVVPQQISDKNIVVASSNNGAVQNIVNELPQIDEISKEFREKIFLVDYFKTISNSKLSGKWIKAGNKNSRELTIEKLEDKNWGAFSLEGGKAENISNLLLNIEFIYKYLKEEYKSNRKIYEEFSKLQKQLLAEQNQIQEYYDKVQELQILNSEYKRKKDHYSQEKIEKQEELIKLCENKEKQSESLSEKIKITENMLKISEAKLEELSVLFREAQRNFDVVVSQKPSLMWVQKVLKTGKAKSYYEELKYANDSLNKLAEQRQYLKKQKTEMSQKLHQAQNDFADIEKKIQQANADFDNWRERQDQKINRIKKQIELIEELKKRTNIDEIDFSKSYEELQISNPWFTKEFRVKQTELFMKALEVKKQFLYENSKHLNTARIVWDKQDEYMSKENGQQLILESWQWLNLAIPVISTTFASFGRMFRNLQENSLGNLFIDEAGQALPQASVGAIFRSKKVMVVGDPSQIKPVLSLDSNMLNLLGQNYQVNEKFVSSSSSTQTIVDDTSQYGFQKDDGEWIGIPLWVHRRSNYPMFTISNEISYNGLMVQGKIFEESQGKSKWFDISGQANDKFVKEQSEYLKSKIVNCLREKPLLSGEIYVITPFKNVAYRLAKELDEIGFTQ
ncbi:AAA domain-containing protein [Enterococcus xiangfangensis]|nr:AAA domain-containing protein [Enterococcus xiangfangensis]MBM7712371.1 superfamily I DNA and/or RNA helicase [Enterococcus xiangfangensis]